MKNKKIITLLILLATLLAIEEGTTGVRILDENYMSNSVAVGISPVTEIPNFTERLNTFIAEIKDDGTIDEMLDRWVVRGDEEMPDIPETENPKIHLTVATAGTEPPYTYYRNNELNGFDIELAKRFAYWMDADLEFKIYDYGRIIAAALSGDVDCIMADLYYLNATATLLRSLSIIIRLNARQRDPVSIQMLHFR